MVTYVEVQGMERVQQRIREIERNVSRNPRLLNDIGIYMTRSIHKNFIQQGRPQAWQPLAFKTLMARRKGKKRGKGVQILRDTGALMNSIERRVNDKDGEVEIGTSLVYARTQHFGRGAIPARPFILIQDEDKDVIMRLIKDATMRRGGVA